MAEGGREVAAHARAVVGQQAHDLQAHGIAERPHDRREVERDSAAGWGIFARVEVAVPALMTA